MTDVALAIIYSLSYWMGLAFLLAASASARGMIASFPGGYVSPVAGLLQKIIFVASFAILFFVAYRAGIVWAVGPFFFLVMSVVFVKSFLLSADRYLRKFLDISALKEKDYIKEKETLQRAEAQMKDTRIYFEKITAGFAAARQTVVCLNKEDLCRDMARIILDYPHVLAVAVFDDKLKKCLAASSRAAGEVKNDVSPPSEKLRQAVMDFMRLKNPAGEFSAENYYPGVLVYPFKYVHKDGSARIMGICAVEMSSDGEYTYSSSHQMTDGKNDLTAMKTFLAENILSVFSLGFVRASLFEEYEIKSRYDSLTGLFNRRYFMDKLQVEIHRVSRYGGGFGIFMADIDHFKKINDTYGHPSGDKALAHLSEILTSVVARRYPGLFWGRYGGEEFVGCIPIVDVSDSVAVSDFLKKIAGDLRQAVEEKRIEVSSSCVARDGAIPSEMIQFPITVSIGVALFPADGDTDAKILAAADSALYEAKSAGRNRVEFYKRNIAHN